MSDISANNKRIVKNTLMLYIRMLFLMVVNLYTTRVILQVLGITDYGIYNVVGGIVAVFSILSQSLSSANSRFINFELGRRNYSRLKLVFSTGVTIQLLLAIIIAVFIEIVGSWFLNYKMIIPENRLFAANWVFQLSIITFCINLISVPYNAAIIAHERMSAFAYISIFEGIAKLAICYLVRISFIDRLITYAFFICLIQLVVRFIYTWYCKKYFEECSFNFVLDKPLMKELFSYAGWNFIGASAAILRTQGSNILINLFVGPIINAAQGIANQINQAFTGFSGNFLVAVNPQITKSYASGDIKYMNTLVNQSSRLSCYLLILLSFPIILNINGVLSVWLKTVPEHASSFASLTLILTIVEAISQPLMTAQLATGSVKYYQISVGGITLLNIPISYVLLKLGYSPESYLLVAITLSVLCLCVKLIIVRYYLQFSILKFIKEVLWNLLLVSTISSVLCSCFNRCLSEGLLFLLLGVFSNVLISSMVIFFVGCSEKERLMVISKVKSITANRIK